MTAEFAAAWFNAKAAQGQQVVMDNRCGVPGDFDTPGEWPCSTQIVFGIEMNEKFKVLTVPVPIRIRPLRRSPSPQVGE